MIPTPIICVEECAALLMHELHRLYPDTKWQAAITQESGALDLKWVGGPLTIQVMATVWHYEAIGIDTDTGCTYEKFFWWDGAQRLRYACSTWPSNPSVIATSLDDRLVKTELSMVHPHREHTAWELEAIVMTAKERYGRRFGTDVTLAHDPLGLPRILPHTEEARQWLQSVMAPTHIDPTIAKIYQ